MMSVVMMSVVVISVVMMLGALAPGIKEVYSMSFLLTLVAKTK